MASEVSFLVANTHQLVAKAGFELYTCKYYMN